MSTDSSASRFLQNARSNLKRVNTHDETKEHDYLGRVLGDATSSSRGSRFREAPAAFQSKRSQGEMTSKKVLGGDFGDKVATGSIGTGRRSGDETRSGKFMGTGMKSGTERKTDIKKAGETGKGAIESGKGVSGLGKGKGVSGLGKGKGVSESSMHQFGTGFTEGGPQEDFGFVGIEDLHAQIRIIEQDIENIMRKLKLSEDRINKHQIRKDQNMTIQKDAGVKAAEMRTLADEKNKEKLRFLEEEYELEKKRQELHRLAMENEMERARSIAIEKTNLDLQKVALRRAEEHERGIQFAKALKERYEYHLKILQTQKELLEFEMRMKDLFSSVPLLNFEPVYIEHEIKPEMLEERRITGDFPKLEKSTVKGTYEGESGTIGDFDTKLQDINYHIHL